VIALAFIGAIVVLTAGGVTVAGASAAHARAQAAADLAALAAADVLVGRSPGAPCDVAERIAAANHASLIGCEPEGAEVVVRVAVPYGGLASEVAARAGPDPGAPQ
jgi:secretion/DNA translocation related TadE-like protein